MKLGSAGPSVMAWIGALLSSLCCLLPLTVIVLGLGSGAFMAVTMRYRWVLIPAGVVGVTTGFALYVRERSCDALACRMVGRRATVTLLIIAGLVVATSIALDRFPAVTSDLLARVTGGTAHGTVGSDMKEMNKRGTE